MDPSVSYRDLYYEWERGQWSTASLSLEEDEKHALDPALVNETERVLATSAAVAEAMVELLVPVVDAAPTEEQQVFLTTQLVDVARHAVLFELCRAGLGLGATPPLGPEIERSLDALRALAELLHGDPNDTGLFVDAMELYSSQIAVPVTALRSDLIERLSEAGALPGVAAGLRLVSRDAERHAAFATKVLEELGAGSARAR